MTRYTTVRLAAPACHLNFLKEKYFLSVKYLGVCGLVISWTFNQTPLIVDSLAVVGNE